MKKILLIIILSSFCIKTSSAVERDFRPVAKVDGETYLLDYNSIKAGEGNEIKYIQLISFKKNQVTSDGKKYLSVQMYMKARCNENMITPYLLQYYDVKMEDGNTMKGNVVRSAKWGGDWQSPNIGTAYHIVSQEACRAWSPDQELSEEDKKLKKELLEAVEEWKKFKKKTNP